MFRSISSFGPSPAKQALSIAHRPSNYLVHKLGLVCDCNQCTNYELTLICFDMFGNVNEIIETPILL